MDPAEIELYMMNIVLVTLMSVNVTHLLIKCT